MDIIQISKDSIWQLTVQSIQTWQRYHYTMPLTDNRYKPL